MAIARQNGGHENYREIDHEYFQTKLRFNRLFSFTGTVDNSPDVNYYAIDEKGSQALYIPEGTSAAIRFTYVMQSGFSTATPTIGTVIAESEVGYVTRDNGGNVTYTGGAIGSGVGNLTITPTANTTVQALELVISDSDSEQTARGVILVEIVNLPWFAEGIVRVFGTTPTTALTAVEPATV